MSVEVARDDKSECVIVLDDEDPTRDAIAPLSNAVKRVGSGDDGLVLRPPVGVGGECAKTKIDTLKKTVNSNAASKGSQSSPSILSFFKRSGTAL